MNSRIYTGEVVHARFSPVYHRFRYPFYCYAFDIDELEQLDRQIWLFGHNRLRPVAVHDRDYVGPESGSIRSKLEALLNREGSDRPLGRVMLVTAARYLHYVFNPVSFFYCYDVDDAPIGVVAQVNNTFKETHLYLLSAHPVQRAGGKLCFFADKVFHVSPFFDREGAYQFFLSEPGESLDILIHYRVDDRLALVARLRGAGQPLTGAALTGLLLRHPLCAALTKPRILTQAARLYWKKKLPVFAKPKPISPLTLRLAPASLLEKVGMWALRRHFQRLPAGSLQIELPDGRELLPVEPEESEPAVLSIRNYRFFSRALLSGEIGFGESYTDGDWSTADLTGLLTLLARNAPVIDDRRLVLTLAGCLINALRHRRRANTLHGSRQNIVEHYDLDNRFFSLFLDPSMTYSSGYFNSEEDSLEDAQRNKLRRVIQKAGLSGADHVLEIGCGWGSFAIEAVRATGCRVTGITLSEEQLAFAREQVKQAGLEKQIDLQLCDYRDVKGQFSRIVSIEMLEAVGHAHLGAFFQACDALLAPGGRAVIQVITMPDQKYDAYRRSSDWIRKHIFPGGHLPALGAMARAMGRQSRLGIGHLEEFGLHYARTLDLWRQRLSDRRQAVLDLGYDEYFLRKWEYYFAYCSAGFQARIIHNCQIVLSRIGEV